MRILAFTPFSGMRGGANRAFVEVLNGLKNKYGHEVHVVVPEEGALCQALDESGIEWEIVESHKLRGVYGKSFGNALRLARMSVYYTCDYRNAKRFARTHSEPFDIVYLNDCDSFIGAITAKLMHVPYVWHFRSHIRPQLWMPPIISNIYRDCGRIIAISDGMKKLLDENPYIPREIVERVYDGLAMEDATPAAPYTGGEFHFVLCGRLAEEKGHRDAIEALHLLRREKGVSDIVLHIAGSTMTASETAYKEKLCAQIAQHELGSQVVFEGQIDDMPTFRQRMNGELMCSVCEPFGRVTVEGMRSGLLVIGSNTGGTPDIVTDGETGLLYEQGDPADLAEKIYRVYSDPVLCQRLAKAGYEFGMTHFTVEENVKNVNRILLQVKGTDGLARCGVANDGK